MDSNHFLEDINQGNSCVWTKDAIETGPDLWRPIALGRHCNTITGREFREILLLSDDLSMILTSQSGFVQWRQNLLPSCTNIILNLRFRNSRSHYNTLSRWDCSIICFHYLWKFTQFTNYKTFNFFICECSVVNLFHYLYNLVTTL